MNHALDLNPHSFQVMLDHPITLLCCNRPNALPNLTFQFQKGSYIFYRSSLGTLKIEGVCGATLDWSSSLGSEIKQATVLVYRLRGGRHAWDFFRSYFGLDHPSLSQPPATLPSSEKLSEPQIQSCECGFQTPYPVAVAGKYTCPGCRTWGHIGA